VKKGIQMIYCLNAFDFASRICSSSFGNFYQFQTPIEA